MITNTDSVTGFKLQPGASWLSNGLLFAFSGNEIKGDEGGGRADGIRLAGADASNCAGSLNKIAGIAAGKPDEGTQQDGNSGYETRDRQR